MINRLLIPIAITVVVGLVTTLGLFFGVAAMATHPGETRLAAGPLEFISIVRTQLESGSTVTVEPGPGLLIMWIVLLAYGTTVGPPLPAGRRRGAALTSSGGSVAGR